MFKEKNIKYPEVGQIWVHKDWHDNAIFCDPRLIYIRRMTLVNPFTGACEIVFSTVKFKRPDTVEVDKIEDIKEEKEFMDNYLYLGNELLCRLSILIQTMNRDL